MELDAEAFEAIVVDELDRLPDDMVDGLESSRTAPKTDPSTCSASTTDMR